MRITAGEFRGRKLTVPDVAGVRPTPSRVREALFNILGSIEGFQLLDLFSGSGLMALEALSRGASSVISIEQNRRVCTHLRDLSEAWDLKSRWQVLQAELPVALARLKQKQFDMVFADPPYGKGYLEMVPQWLDANDIVCRRLVIEESSTVGAPTAPGWTHEQARRYGDTCLHFFNKGDAS